MGSQRVGHDWATSLQNFTSSLFEGWKSDKLMKNFKQILKLNYCRPHFALSALIHGIFFLNSSEFIVALSGKMDVSCWKSWILKVKFTRIEFPLIFQFYPTHICDCLFDTPGELLYIKKESDRIWPAKITEEKSEGNERLIKVSDIFTKKKKKNYV